MGVCSHYMRLLAVVLLACTMRTSSTWLAAGVRQLSRTSLRSARSGLRCRQEALSSLASGSSAAGSPQDTAYDPALLHNWETRPPAPPGFPPPPGSDAPGNDDMVRTLISLSSRRSPWSQQAAATAVVAPRAVGAAASDASLEDVSALLKSKTVKGVGPKLAQTLLSTFGARALEVLRGEGSAEETTRLHAIHGIGEKTLIKIRSSMETWDALKGGLTFCTRRPACLPGVVPTCSTIAPQRV